MKHILKTLLVAAVIVTCATGVVAQVSVPGSNPKLWSLYKDAVMNSAYTDSSKIWNGLVKITPGNPTIVDTMINGEKYILVVLWKANNNYAQTNTLHAQPISTEQSDLWVTISPELRQKARGVKPGELDLRLEQILGLPPVEKYYNYIFEFWVRPQDIYRPCPDMETNDNTCQLAFPSTVTPGHRAWIDSQRINKFFGGEPSARYAWTQLGYTYDWSPTNATHRGCSEFVIRKWTTIYQRHFYNTSDYFNRK